MAYSKLGNIKGPQGRRGLNMTGGTTPPTVDDDVLEGDLWLDSVTGDVYRASAPDPWRKDGTWYAWGTALWKVADNVFMVQPAEGDAGTLGEPAQGALWYGNPSRGSMTSVRSKGTIAMNADSKAFFQTCTSLTDISALSGWDMSGVTDMSDMFSGCGALTDISALSGWNVSGVTSMSTTFYNCTSLANLSALSDWNVSNVTDMGDMFSSCGSIANLSPISGWDVSGVTRMSAMFCDCTSLTDISALSGWNVSNVTDMSDMFSGCTSLADISALSGWNVSNVTDMYGIFSSCPVERIGIPSLEHGGKNFVSMLEDSCVVTDMDAIMLTNTTTHESMSANQILTDMDANPSKYATGTIWTL